MKPIQAQKVFPQSWLKGSSLKGIQRQRMRQRALASWPINQEKFAQKVAQHQQFLKEGGGGGHWQLLQVEGLVVPLYQKEKLSFKATQFSLEYGQLGAEVNFTRQVLPYINCCGANLSNLEAKEAVLSYSLFTDCLLEKADFRKAILCGVDFSRAELAGADFRQADLSQVDFENCDLRGADFRGAKIAGAKFPGAILEEVKI